MDDVMQCRMDEHLSNTKWDIRAALQRFEDSGIKIDRRFRRDFIKQTTDCVIDTCERYSDDINQKKSQKEKLLDCEPGKKSLKQNQVSKDNINGNGYSKSIVKCSLKRLKREREDGSPENSKHRKTHDVTDSVLLSDQLIVNIETELNIAEPKPKPEHPTCFFYCAHCTDTNELNESIGGTIEDVYNHWRMVHVVEMASKPFQFYVAEIAACLFGDAIGTYRELIKHHQQAHSNEPFVIVNYNNRNKCGICLKSSDTLIDHFQNEHKSITPKSVLNPMQLTDITLNQLMKIDIHKQHQCVHCNIDFETEDDLEIHHKVEHEDKEKISKLYSDQRILYFICGYCQEKVSRGDFFGHLRSHVYVFKCWKCTYQTKDLVDLVLHDKVAHERDTLEYHCSMFPDWVRTHFNNTKVIFSNGLVLWNYNLFGTKIDDSKLFDIVIDSLVELIKMKASLVVNEKDIVEAEPEINVNLSPVGSEDDAQFLSAQLSKQNELANNLVVLKLPRIANMELHTMFLKLCDKLKVKVARDDIQQIHRRKQDGYEFNSFREGADDTIVYLKSNKLKEDIRIAAQRYPIHSGDVYDLPPGQWSKRIKIISHTTQYYGDMMSIAKEARSDRIIQNYELTTRGISVKRTPKSGERIFTSKTDLLNFVNRSRNK